MSSIIGIPPRELSIQQVVQLYNHSVNQQLLQKEQSFEKTAADNAQQGKPTTAFAFYA
jgi:hypothetical protein